jgi:sporulation protein YlmC with PRC-barrel domain
MSKTTISRATEYIIGSEVVGSDGVCGDLRRIIVDPAARAITHLVVEHRHRQGEGHLVPIELVDSAAHTIQLTCSTPEFRSLPDAEETHFLPGPGELSYTDEQMRSLHSYGGMAGGGGMYGLGTGNMGGMGVGEMGAMGRGPIRHAIVTDDHVPAGEIELRRGQPVHATDGAVGGVQGLLVDSDDHHVTHVLLDEGHLWGKRRVAIPISAVTSIDDGVQLNVTKDEVSDYKPPTPRAPDDPRDSK